jgi:hypothetical protein
MSTLRAGQPGATRLCPHCKATVLESASICPGCRHHLRFSGGRQLAEESYTALSVDGTIAHRPSAEPCEYCIVLDISNERGEQVMRQVVGVGALQPGELRRLNLSVQMLPLVVQTQPRPQAGATTASSAPAAAARPSLGKPTMGTGAGTGASTSGSAPSSKAGVSTGVPGTARQPAPAPAGASPKATTSPSATPAAPSSTPAPQPPGAAQSQRLRIFRKP